MAQNPNESLIVYRFLFADGQSAEHTIALTETPPATGHAEWTRLGFHQCPHCPLATEQTSHCPFATALEAPVHFLGTRPSHSEVDVQVTHRGRTIHQHTTLQRAVGSMLGAIGATSGCPHTDFLRAMAWFHQPFSDNDETLFRAIGTYLLGQHLRAMQGLPADWSLAGLREGYKNLRLLNQGIAKRLRSAAQEDSSVNGLILLDLLASSALNSLDQYEGELDRYFADYLPDQQQG
jgi:hypothetical protein